MKAELQRIDHHGSRDDSMFEAALSAYGNIASSQGRMLETAIASQLSTVEHTTRPIVRSCKMPNRRLGTLSLAKQHFHSVMTR